MVEPNSIAYFSSDPDGFNIPDSFTVFNIAEIAHYKREGRIITVLYKSGIRDTNYFTTVEDAKQIELIFKTYWGIQ